MKNDIPASDLAEDGADLYPHLKITAETFPRILVTRRIQDDDAEYYGAFLSRTSARILIDFLNRTFRLRSCDIEIDGGFPVPCTQFYLKRCLAPCVENLCDRESYLEMVSLARLFLQNQRSLLTAELTKRINTNADDLEFELAAFWRDILVGVENFWKNPRWQVWIDDCVDTYVPDETIAGSFIYLATQRGRNVLGRKVFQLPKGGGMSADEALKTIVESFYKFHLPREIRVAVDFEGRNELAHQLGERFGRPVKIILARPDKHLITSIRALRLARSENDLDFAKQVATPRQISGELKRLFGLTELPKRVEAFDVAHLSGTSFVAASSVWQDGRFLSEEYRFHVSDETSEPKALAEAVVRRLADASGELPDIILLDGAKPQMNAVLKELSDVDPLPTTFVGAVKPRGQHSSVAYFLTQNGEHIEYDPDNPAQNMLRLLRDAAHDLANRVHRDLRDMGHHYELAAMLPGLTETERRRLIADLGSVKRLLTVDEAELIKLAGPERSAQIIEEIKNFNARDDGPSLPFVVPIRFDAEGGNADDMRPIAAN
jgi:excinuclease ABC subunit C